MSDQPPPIRQVTPIAPLNALPLDYTPPVSGRPGLITAIGVISIIVSVISGLSSLGYGFASMGMLMMSTIRIPAPVTPQQKVSAVRGQIVLTVGPRGLEQAQRRIAINGLRQSHDIAPKRVKMLDALLADSGQDLFTFGGESITVKAVESSVSESGQVHKLSGEPGPDYFILGGGRLEIYDDHAVFMPSDGRETIRVSEDDIATEGSVLTPGDVQAVIAQAQNMSGNKLTAAQVASLKTQLEAQTQSLIDKSKGVAAKSQLVAVQVQPNGIATVQTMNGFVVMDANGVVTYSMSTAGFMGGPGGGSPIKVSPGASATVMIASFLSIGLAIYLLVIGILTLRQSLRARRLHLIYAMLKIPLAIIACLGVYSMALSFVTTITPMGPGGAVSTRSTQMSIGIVYGGLALVGIIYPIALLITLNTRGMREYYLGVQRG